MSWKNGTWANVQKMAGPAVAVLGTAKLWLEAEFGAGGGADGSWLYTI